MYRGHVPGEVRWLENCTRPLTTKSLFTTNKSARFRNGLCGKETDDKVTHFSGDKMHPFLYR